MKSSYPPGWYLYAILIASSSLLIPFGLHRTFYALLRDLSVPALGISALTGITNLSWYELAYVIGGAFKTVILFTLLPFLGSATGLLSVGLQFTGVRWRQRILMAHLAFGLAVATLSLMILLWRLWRGFVDPWRLVTVTTFLLAYGGWIIYFVKSRRVEFS